MRFRDRNFKCKEAAIRQSRATSERASLRGPEEAIKNSWL
jgi:hypothetical protein